MLKIALTGGIGSGKSTVCNIFSRHNTPVIDTDIIAREIVEPGQVALQEIVDVFGANILSDDSSLNRKALANKIFNDKNKRLQLESILHPKIRQITQTKIEQLNTCYVIIAIPLLIETNQQTEYDRVIVVDCDEQQQLERTLTRDKRNRDEVISIIKSQVSRKQRTSVADDIIDNSQNLETLESQIEQLHNKYMELCRKGLC
jgi:dephospho-CoA kinase